MLNQLLEIKRRRERALRAKAAQLTKQDEKIRSDKRSVLAAREQWQQQWRELAEHKGCLDRRQFEEIQINLRHLREREGETYRQSEILDKKLAQLQQERSQQDILLKKILRAQEKLSIMLESN